MFELGRELKRFFSAERTRAPSDGLTRGDTSLLELLDARLLAQEAKASDIAAGRVGAKDKPARRLEAAIVWREVARRTGDPVALRKAAAGAEIAATGFDATHRRDGWARARCEQAFCALLGAEIFGDPGLAAAAEVAFNEARSSTKGGLAAPLADIGIAALEGRRLLEGSDVAAARAWAARLNAPIAALDTIAKRVPAARALAAEARLIRADLLSGWGARLRDGDLLDMAAQDAAAAADRLDSAFEPLTWARAKIAHGQALALRGEAVGDVDTLAAGAGALALAMDNLTRDHSPLDWARTQVALGQSLQALGEAASDARAFEHAVSCFDRASLVLKDTATLPLRGVAASARAVCLARVAEITGDRAVLDVAEAAMKIELAALSPGRDPVGWALAQLHLARLYEARLGMTGIDKGERAAAMMALDAALDVFGEHGLRSASVLANDAMDRLRDRSDRPTR
jgi:tetratricopeptide (TPR) repeat protein